MFPDSSCSLQTWFFAASSTKATPIPPVSSRPGTDSHFHPTAKRLMPANETYARHDDHRCRMLPTRTFPDVSRKSAGLIQPAFSIHRDSEQRRCIAARRYA